jgi:hypothetical protein
MDIQKTWMGSGKNTYMLIDINKKYSNHVADRNHWLTLI